MRDAFFMDITVDEILKIIKSNSEYSGSNIKSSGKKISIYKNFPSKDRNPRINAIKQLTNYIKNSVSPEISNRVVYDSSGSGSSIGRIEIYTDKNVATKSNTIVVVIKPEPKISILANWKLNEEMFADICSEYLDYAKEDGKKFNIKIVGGVPSKSILIKHVNSIASVGGKNKKRDIVIKTQEKTVGLSIKLPNFGEWQNGASSQTAKDAATKVLDNLRNITASFGPGSSGVSVVSTIQEVNEFCFGGSDINNKVDYILVANFPSVGVSKSFSYEMETATLTISVNKIYDALNPIDKEDVRKNCYLLVTKNSQFNIGNKYRGYKISYVSQSKIGSTLPGKR